MLKNIIFIMCIFMMSSIVFAETLYTESFDYSDAFANHGWTYSKTSGNAPNTAQDTNGIFAPYSYAWNTTNTGGVATATVQIYRNVPVPKNTGTYTFDFDYYFNRESDFSSYQGLLIYDVGLVNNIGLFLGRNLGVTGKQNQVKVATTFTGGTECNITDNITIGYQNGFRLELDLGHNTYSVYHLNASGTFPTLCSDIAMGTFSGNITRMTLQSVYAPTSSIEWAIDNFVVSTNETEVYGVGVPCSTNDECLTGKCQGGVCVEKLFNEECSSSVECISGSCLNGKCTRPSMVDTVTAGITNSFGGDEDTLNFISFIVMAFTMCVIIFFGRNAIAVVGAVFLFIVEGFFFAIIGWLSPFILLGIIFAGLVAFVVYTMLKGNSN